MTAFNNNILFSINENVRILGKRLKVASAKRITDDEFLQLFVPEEHHDAFKTIGPLLWRPPTQQIDRQIAWPSGSTVVFLMNGTKLPIPREPHLQPDAPVGLVQSITHWTTNGGDASRDTGRISAVLGWLNEKCASKQELRYYFPSILTLLAAYDGRSDLIELGKQLADVKVPKNPAPIPRDIRAAMKKAAETVAVMSLIPADIGERAPSGITITVADGALYQEPGIGQFSGAYIG